MDKLPLRMYHLVHRSLSPIQKGIQAGHGAVEYMYQSGALKEPEHQRTIQFAKTDKTFIVLDGGTSSDMQYAIEILKGMNMPHVIFAEPDMNNMITCISFLSNDDNKGFSAWVNDFKLAN